MAASLALPDGVKAAMVSGSPVPTGIPRRAFVGQPSLVTQACPEWCWAASASMISATHNHPVNQIGIVRRVFGQVACWSGQSITIAQVLSSAWVDDNGSPFQSQIVSAYDFSNRINAINDYVIVNELINDSPLLYGNRHHAMVIGQADYLDTPTGPQIRDVWVFDPYPGVPPLRTLTPAERTPQHLGGDMGFLAAVRVNP